MANSYSDFFEAVRQRESSGNYQAENGSGYLGAYQFGELALIDLGYYTRDGTSANDWRSSSFTGKNGINSKQDFLNNPEVQDAAAAEWFELLWTYIRRFDLEFYDGQTLNGVKLTKTGMIAAAHLVGVGGLKNFIDSKGFDAASDGNGVSLVSYIRLFEGYDTPDRFLNNLDQGNTIAGGAGVDQLNGRSGDDDLSGGAGRDTLKGDAGDDELNGDGARDDLLGDGGMDTLKGGGGNDKLRGGNGKDRLVGGSGDDTMKGDDGRDTLIVSDGRDVVWGGGDADSFVFRPNQTKGNKVIFKDIEDKDQIDLTEFDVVEIFAGGKLDLTDDTPEPDGFYLIAADVQIKSMNAQNKASKSPASEVFDTSADWLLVQNTGGALTVVSELMGAVDEDHFLI